MNRNVLWCLVMLVLGGCAKEPSGPNLAVSSQPQPGEISLTVCATTQAMATLEGWPLCQ